MLGAGILQFDNGYLYFRKEHTNTARKSNLHKFNRQYCNCPITVRERRSAIW